MTDNHLLLYRIAELMFEHEQHILPVDILFDDKQIGDFVKSIQIDSPYQQMLLEGVLTESLRDEKLFVSYTVEGYFHYLLGEVLWELNRINSKFNIIELSQTNKTNGLKEGITQLLEKQVFEGDISLLLYCIDFGLEPADYCAIPLANAFLLFNNEDRNNSSGNSNIETLIQKLLEEHSKNDFNVILDAIFYLEKKQKNKCLFEIFECICEMETDFSIDLINIFIRGFNYLADDKKKKTLQKIEMEVENFKSDEVYPELLMEIGTEYVRIGLFEKAIQYYELSLNIFEARVVSHEDKKEKLYSNLGSAFWYLNIREKAGYYYNLSFNTCLKLYGPEHVLTAGAYHNLALIKVLEEDYEASIKLFTIALNIELKDKGENHTMTARTYSNIGSAYLRLRNLNQAQKCFEKSKKIDTKVLHTMDPNLALDYDDLGDVYFGKGEMLMAKESYEKSKSIFTFNYGSDFPHVIMLNEKLEKLNDL